RSVSVISYIPSPLAASAVPGALWITAAAIWIAGALLALGQLSYLHWQLRQQIRDRRTLTPGDAMALGIVTPDSVRITVVRGLGIPFALSREVCLPEWVVDRIPESELRAVIAHELAHVRRHDAFWRSAVSAIARAFFFQPLNRVAAGRLRELSECICDDEAVAATRSSVSLAIALETVARKAMSHTRHASLAPAMGAPVSLTLKRVERILAASAGGRRAPTLGWALQVALAAIAGVLAVGLAPSVEIPALAFTRYTINAEDPAGRFSVTLEKGRVIGATLAGRHLSPREVRQRGVQLELADGNSAPLSVRLTPQGGLRWSARPAANPTMH
ncbi:MAG: M56 family metallopeptidase, partial [Gemmatimonadales bacterium]